MKTRSAPGHAGGSFCLPEGYRGEMFQALDDRGENVEPQPRHRAFCPLCREQVIAKCGEIVVWHWAHVRDQKDCDAWAEPETSWHRWWKQRVPVEQREVARGQHRADIFVPGRGVVELQHSPISEQDVAARESHYGEMIWILDARLYRPERLILTRRNTWLWNQPRASFARATKTLCFDLGAEILVTTQRSFAGGAMLLRGARMGRTTFLEKLKMVPPEQGEVGSYIARWYERSRPRNRTPLEGEYSLNRKNREFRDLKSLELWASQKERAYLGIFAWTESGELEKVRL